MHGVRASVHRFELPHMHIPSSGQLLTRLPRAHFNALYAAKFASETLPGFQTKPLFAATHRIGLSFAQAVSDKPDWVVATPAPQPDKHPWDIAHQHVRGLAPGSTPFAAMGDVYIEPDLLQPGSPEPPAPPVAPINGLNDAYPPVLADNFSPAWHLGPGYSNFQAAWAKSTGKNVRIAHLDTGYWPAHNSTPRNIRPEQGYNFYEDNQNLVDPGLQLGFLYTRGHGTATLALLAGNNVNLTYNNQSYTGPFGGAPDAEIIPVRISPSVVHFYTKQMAQGLDYACAPGNFAPCQVVSLSHGGLPNSCWAAAVNRCYEAGIVIAAASGDSYYAVIANVATRFTVYPSAFNRVITATGVTYAHAPYITNVPFKMQGCWGPDSVMAKAVGAYTPNVPWMRWNTDNDWDMDGAGTSASTPQIAAACALWLSLYGSRFSIPWQRGAACREALLNSVANAGANPSQIGRGTLDADAMLDPALADRIQQAMAGGQLQKAPLDEVSFPFWRLLFGIAPPNSGVDQMYETEAAQVLARSQNATLLNAVQSHPDGQPIPTSQAKQLQAAFLAEPSLSNALRQYLEPRAI